ncbi:MAG TPA: carboxymuconolactone decarboxylase family protein [Rhodopila sp.]|uniref:carboxymuconolactone decarboxylase family protein n=1 Tax=Rhodopila sp. TaxID=2480087 RepID=UPI002CC3EC7E|nr:carboxymuconolactone decarboxylase family protein [Rhodopila sp.]HVY15466.1 carboxymuconolactone decarboxylase family protein [Rhodopila sp.]
MTRQDLRHQGETMLRTLFGSAAQTAGFGHLLTEAAYGGIWSRPALDLPDRLVCAIAALGAIPRLKALRRHVAAGLEQGLSAEAIREILVQAALYSGFSAAEETLDLAGEVFAEHGIQFPADPPEDAPLEELDRRGAELMAALHGDRATQGYAAPDNPVTGALYPSAIRFGYGEIWFRPGLDRRRRALVSIAAFTALRLPAQVAKFGQSALNMGLTRPQVIEAIIQTAPLTGFPPALNALGALGEAFR